MRCVGILVQAPIPGRVKLRLSDDVGPSAAAEVYWQVGRRIVSRVVGPGYRTTVWFTPSSEGAFVREWLDGLGRIEYRAQSPGQLGERLAHAFARHFADGARRAVVVVGDYPGIDRRLVTEALAALGQCDIVLGPTSTAGCYLVGLKEPQPALLRGLRRSAVGSPPLVHAKARAVAAGLRVRVLRPLRDLRTVQDARVLGLLESRSTIDGTSS